MARSRHTENLLTGGQVLVAGGLGVGPTGFDFVTFASSELYDPATRMWTPTGPMTTARESHTATRLTNGRILAAGGISNFPLGGESSAELYDPANRVWQPTGAMGETRANHTATLLSNGRVLVVGGENDFAGMSLATAELYDPATGTWRPTGSLATARKLHTATVLPDGKVLVAGGLANMSKGITSAELYDPATGQWTSTGTMNKARGDHTATMVAGRVLVVGGASETTTEATTELYDPATRSWSLSASLAAARSGHTATLLPRGSVLVAGGCSGACLRSSELRLAADLAVTVGGSADRVLVGQELTYTITVRNAGPDEARNVTLRDELPAGVELVSASSQCSQESAGVVACSVGDLASGAFRVERRITVRPGQATPALSNTVTAQSVSDDPQSADNAATVTTEVRSDAPPAGDPPAGDPSEQAAPPAASPATEAPAAAPSGPASRTPLPAGRVPAGIVPEGVAALNRASAAAAAAQARRAQALRRCLSSARRRKGASRRLAQRRCVARHGRTPGRVTRLRTRAVSSRKIVLSFVAAGSDRSRPPAARDYLIKQALRPIRTARDFARAPALCAGRCRFSRPRVGRRLNLTIFGLRPKSTYYYAVAARDNVSGRAGPRSQSVRVKTP
ncbi:MAG: kelch repeat-containing protein [Solirubrobacteraceae bacterium]